MTMREGRARVGIEESVGVRELSAVVDVAELAGPRPSAHSPCTHTNHLVRGGARTARRPREACSDLASGRGGGCCRLPGGGYLLAHRGTLVWRTDMYFEPEQILQRRGNGSWREKYQPRHRAGSLQWSPVWLVEGLREVAEATAVEQETIGNSPSGISEGDPIRRARPPNPSTDGRAPASGPIVQLSRSTWGSLSAGRLRRIVASFAAGEPDEVVNEWTARSFELTLNDFGHTPAPASRSRVTPSLVRFRARFKTLASETVRARPRWPAGAQQAGIRSPPSPSA